MIDGVAVTGVRSNSVACRAGIDPGTVILKANQKPVKDAAGFGRAVKESGRNKQLLLRNVGVQRFVALSW